MPSKGSRRGNSKVPAVLTINRAAELLGVAPATLRRWDEAGKFVPVRHPMNGYRLYRVADLERLKRSIGSIVGR